MCDFKVWLQKEEDVYVLQCTTCNTFQVRLRKMAFLFTVFEYKVFKETITDIYNDFCRVYSENHCVPTFNRGIRILLDSEELEELYLLLEAADTEMKIAQMAAMFY